MRADWTRRQLEEMMDRVIDGWTSDKIAQHMTRMFRHHFTRGAIIGMMNREFGGIKIFLANFVKAWPDDPKADMARKSLGRLKG